MSTEAFYWQDLSEYPIIGVDEVGRGCLAGRVYAAAVILGEGETSEFVDSKTLSEKRRKIISNKIWALHQVGIGFATVEEIAEINILWASLLAMKRAVLDLKVSSGHVLVDGSHTIKGLEGFKQTAVIKGDQRVASIAAASIVAKVTRDEYMSELEVQYSQYGFSTHKGYGTKYHKAAIRKWGPCKEHRRLFAGVKEYWPQKNLELNGERVI